MADKGPNPQEVMEELQGMVNAHVKLAFDQYKELRDSYVQSNETIEFLKKVTPKAFHENLENTKSWMDTQFSAMEENLEKMIEETQTWKSDKGVPAPALKEITKMVSTHMKLAFKEYKALRDRYGTPTKATVAYIKSVAPATTHEALDKFDSWVDEQVSNIEGYVEKALGEEDEDRPMPSPPKKRKR
jgi:hypothetical protein